MVTPRNHRRLGRLKLVIFSLLPVVILLGSAEVGLRVYGAHLARVERGHALPPPAQRHKYQREDPVLGYSLRPGYNAGGIRVNQLGFRGAEITRTKPPNAFRIAAIGDSTTFGLAGEGCPYPVQLQDLLNAGDNKRKFEVINAGVEGYSSIYALRLLETRIAPLQPDLVTIYVGWNDLYGHRPFQANLPKSYQISKNGGTDAQEGLAARIRSYLDKLYLVQVLRRIIYRGLPRIVAYVRTDPDGPARQPHPQMTEAYEYRLKRMIDEISAMGAKPVILTLPTIVSSGMSNKVLSLLHYPTWASSNYETFHAVIEAYNSVICRVAAEKKVVLIDNAEFVDRLGGRKEDLFFDSLHMYCAGYELLAKNMRDKFLEQRVIPRD